MLIIGCRKIKCVLTLNGHICIVWGGSSIEIMKSAPKTYSTKTGTDTVYSNLSSGEADIGRCPGLTLQLAYLTWQVPDEKNKVDDMWRVIADIVFWPPH